MINKITVTNHLEESLTMELRSPLDSGFAVSYIEGLGPIKAEINLTERAGIDGSIYNSARAILRNVVITLRFLFVPDIETVRQKSYMYFPLKKRIRLEIETDNRIAYLYGYVESNEPDIFSSEEGCIISILCPDSYLYDILESYTVFSSVTPLFEFPFSNESLVSPLIEFSEIDSETEKTVIYTGDAPIGILLHIHATGSASGFSITNSRTLESLSIDSAKLIATVGADISEGDDFWISTVQGDKYAILIRGGQEYSILNCLGTDPTWFQLERGDNIFAYTATSGLANLQFEIINKIAYEGI